MKVYSKALGLLQANCYLIVKEDQALIIDPGDEAQRIVQAIEDLKVQPLAILLTHAHFDHFMGAEELLEKYPVDLYLHPQEKDFFNNPFYNGSFSMPQPVISDLEANQDLVAGAFEIGPFSFEVRPTPGHSPGSVSLIFEDEAFLISGDALFRESIGRTDLAFGSMESLIHSIQSQLLVLDDDMTVYPGHGPATTIGHEKKHNPFLKGLS